MYGSAAAKDWPRAAAALDAARARGVHLPSFIERAVVVEAYAKAGREADTPPEGPAPGAPGAADDGGVEENIVAQS